MWIDSNEIRIASAEGMIPDTPGTTAIKRVRLALTDGTSLRQWHAGSPRGDDLRHAGLA
jgi:proline racemase